MQLIKGQFDTRLTSGIKLFIDVGQERFHQLSPCTCKHTHAKMRRVKHMVRFESLLVKYTEPVVNLQQTAQ